MDCHLYFHDDLDGVLSAALIRDFFISNKNKIVSLNPIEFWPTFEKDWPSLKFKEPFVLVDFRYHPKASYWFDHHQTAFLKDEWADNYKNDDAHFFDPKSPSCFSMISYFLKREHGFPTHRSLADLLETADIVDSGGYESAEDALNLDTPSRQLAVLLNSEYAATLFDYNELQEDIIEKLTEVGLNEILEKYGEVIWKIKKAMVESRLILNRDAQVFGNSVLFNSANKEVVNPSFVSYFLFPGAKFAVVIKKMDDGYRISVGKNPWGLEPSGLNVGKYLSKYNGGGHESAGGVNVDNIEEALKIAEEIVKYLNANG